MRRTRCYIQAYSDSRMLVQISQCFTYLRLPPPFLVEIAMPKARKTEDVLVRAPLQSSKSVEGSLRATSEKVKDLAAIAAPAEYVKSPFPELISAPYQSNISRNSQCRALVPINQIVAHILIIVATDLGDIKGNSISIETCQYRFRSRKL